MKDSPNWEIDTYFVSNEEMLCLKSKAPNDEPFDYYQITVYRNGEMLFGDTEDPFPIIYNIEDFISLLRKIPEHAKRHFGEGWPY